MERDKVLATKSTREQAGSKRHGGKREGHSDSDWERSFCPRPGIQVLQTLWGVLSSALDDPLFQSISHPVKRVGHTCRFYSVAGVGQKEENGD